MESNLLQMLFGKYGKAQLTPQETYEVTGRSVAMLQKDRTDGVGIEYIKIGKGPNAKVFYPIKSIVDFLENKTIKTA
jgi:hypothetical protein